MTDWEKIVKKYGPRVWRSVIRITGNEQDAHDCFQETFLAAFAFAQHNKIKHLGALLGCIATRKAIEKLRSRNTAIDITNDYCDMDYADAKCNAPDKQMRQQELAVKLRNALKKLPEDEAQIFCMKYIEEMSYKEIAKQTQITASTIGVIIHRTRKKLRNLLECVAVEEGNEV